MKAIFGHDLAAELLILRLNAEGYQINMTWPWSWSFDCALSLRGKPSRRKAIDFKISQHTHDIREERSES